LKFFGKVYDPLNINTKDHEEMRAMLRAINEIAALEGETKKLEERLNK